MLLAGVSRHGNALGRAFHGLVRGFERRELDVGIGYITLER